MVCLLGGVTEVRVSGHDEYSSSGFSVAFIQEWMAVG